MGRWSRSLIRPLREVWLNRNSPIQFYGFWDYSSIFDLWFYRFIRHRNILEKASVGLIQFYSVFGHNTINIKQGRKDTLSVFFTGENLDHFPKYGDHLIGKVDLSLGFDYIDRPNYLRFPLWLLYVVQPDWDYDQITEHLSTKYGSFVPEQRNGFCCLVASHDRNGIRRQIMDEVLQFGPVDSSGKIYNNCDLLKSKYNDRKDLFLQQYYLNICPENSNKNGYTTEKLFQSIENGCIPIYWGSDGKPEPEILNPSCYLIYNPTERNAFLEKMEAFTRDPFKFYSSWASLPKWNLKAPEIIWNYLNAFEQSLIRIRNQT